ncbi:MAG: hypothetical protein KA244_07420 [Deltaproteobacteria bacterium]|nr:hypothetical protein [Deltaproteobacteria bacterium]
MRKTSHCNPSYPRQPAHVYDAALAQTEKSPPKLLGSLAQWKKRKRKLLEALAQ